MDNLHVLIPTELKKQARDAGLNLSLLCREAIRRKLDYQKNKLERTVQVKQ